MRYKTYTNNGKYFGLGLLVFFVFGGFKTVFLILPLFFSLAPLIIVGFIATNLIRRIGQNRVIEDTLKGASTKRLHFVELSVHLMVHAMRCDGAVDKREIQAIKTFFSDRVHFDASQLIWVDNLIHYANRKHISMHALMEAFNTECTTDEKRLTIELLVAVIASDGKVVDKELELLNQVAQSFEISSATLSQLKTQHFATIQTPYSLLGITEAATPEQIKDAYKTLSKQYHPDKVHHLGAEFKAFAEAKQKEINNAYTALTAKQTE